MKNYNYILLILLSAVLNSCDNRRGKVSYNIKFTTEDVNLTKVGFNSKKVKSALSTTEYYTQFGDYITSLTPYKFTARIWTIGYIDKVPIKGTNNANMLQYIEQNSEKLSFNDPSRTVDFSNNNVVSFDPVIYGKVSNNKQFEDPQINFSYFYFIPYNFYQEFQIPTQYQNIQINMFPDVSISNNILKINNNEMLKKVFPNARTDNFIYFIFGNTDSTFVVNGNGEFVNLSENCPIAEPGQSLTIRSSKYSNMVYNTPKLGENVVMSGILSFDTQNLIQIYAGADNIPYTSDDIFVYAPKFWERIYSKLDVL